MSLSETELREAYDAAEFDMVAMHDNLSLPTSRPLVLKYDEEQLVEDVSEAVTALSDGGERFIWIATFQETQTSTGRFQISTDILDEQTGDRFKMKADSDMVRLFPREDKFSIDTARAFGELVMEGLNTGLTAEPGGSRKTNKNDLD